MSTTEYFSSDAQSKIVTFILANSTNIKPIFGVVLADSN